MGVRQKCGDRHMRTRLYVVNNAAPSSHAPLTHAHGCISTGHCAYLPSSHPLMWVWLFWLVGHFPVVHVLLKNGADPNCPTLDEGSTPLYMAAMQGHPDVARLLLANQADPNMATTDYGCTPLMVCLFLLTPFRARARTHSNTRVLAPRTQQALDCSAV